MGVFPFGNDCLLNIHLKTNLTTGRIKRGRDGYLDGTPAATFADSSSESATCSTTCDGDHFRGARGVVHTDSDFSAAAIKSSTAARLSASATVISGMQPPYA